MIVDCFNIYNEIEILLLRLDYLYDTVDLFVIVESLDSHSKKVRKTSYMFEDNVLLFRKYLDKIRYLKLDYLPAAGDSGQVWPNENFQKNCCGFGIQDLGPEDWIMFSDVDEIPRKECVLELKNNTGYYLIQFQQHLFYYYVNLLQTQVWSGTVAVQRKRFDESFKNMMGLRSLRNAVHPLIKSFPDAGWHYSYMGGIDRIFDKMSSYAESDENTPFHTAENIAQSLETHKDLFDRKEEFCQKRLVDVFSTTTLGGSGPLLSPPNLQRVLSLFPSLFYIK